jgi:hypothetical protein
MNNTQDSPSKFFIKLDADNARKLNGSSDTLILYAYLDEENKTEEKEDEKITYFSFKNYRSKSCIIL